MDPRPFYVVFAGVNGAGKSTLFRSNLWRMDVMPQSMTRVNPDETLRAMGGNWADAHDQLVAGKASLRTIEECLSGAQSFNQETTLTGHRPLRTIIRAHDAGYRVFLFYVGVADAGVAIERIRHRVAIGGHNIDEDVVRKRYHASLAQFSRALPYCEEAHVFDNTTLFKRIALWSNNTLAWWGASRSVGNWLPDAMSNEGIWR